MNWLHYLLEANLYLAAFYLGYYLFLSRETYYTLNRFYLLFSCVVSFALPVLQLNILKPVEQPVTAVNFSFPVQTAAVETITYVPEAGPQFTWQDGLVYAYFIGAAILFMLLLIKLYHLFRMTRVEISRPGDNYKLISIDRSTTAFSFFNYLFIGTKVQGPETIIKHELVHIRQKHSADIIFIELLKIVNWFNPVIYLLQYSIKTLHEYIADEQTAAAETDTLAYSAFLLNNAYGLDGASITNSFFNYNLLKKRIIMLNQKRSGSLARLKYLLAVPIFMGLLCASTLAFSKTYGWVNIGPHRIDKNNKSPQVAEPKRSLLVRQHGLSYLTDKFSYKRVDGTTRIYTGYNLSNKDIVDLAKKGIQIDVLYDAKVETGNTKKLTFGSGDTAKRLAPPPPPAPPVTAIDKRPPPPPAPPAMYTKKGYRYREDGYSINGKTDFRVLITTKDGNQKAYFRSKASAADIKLLKDKYGYTFPNMEIYTKLPPPPPEAPVPAVKKHAAIVPAMARTNKHLVYTTTDSSSTNSSKPSSAPVIVVNGEIYKLTVPFKKGQELSVDASGGETGVMFTNKDLDDAIAKYGPDAKNGVIFATGKTTVTVKPVPPVKRGAIVPKAKADVIQPKKTGKNSVYSDITQAWQAIAFNTSKRGC